MRGDKSQVSKFVAGKKPAVSISGSVTNTILKTTSSKIPIRASRSAPERVKRKQTTPRQDNIFRRFTALLVNFIRDKFIWAKTDKSQIDLISEEHDKRIADNYVFDEVLGRHISRTEYKKKAKLNQDSYKPTTDEISRFPSRPKNTLSISDHDVNLHIQEFAEHSTFSPPKLKHSKYKCILFHKDNPLSHNRV